MGIIKILKLCPWSFSYSTCSKDNIRQLAENYTGIWYGKTENGCESIIPDEYCLGHESHFRSLAEVQVGYLWSVNELIRKFLRGSRIVAYKLG